MVSGPAISPSANRMRSNCERPFYSLPPWPGFCRNADADESSSDVDTIDRSFVHAARRTDEVTRSRLCDRPVNIYHVAIARNGVRMTVARCVSNAPLITQGSKLPYRIGSRGQWQSKLPTPLAQDDATERTLKQLRKLVRTLETLLPRSE